MRVRNFSTRFLKARKIGTLKSFTLSCNARIQLRQKSLLSQINPFVPNLRKFLNTTSVYKAQINAL
nr:MAG TPA: hypothetical protein [Caudoviricetes sp.]